MHKINIKNGLPDVCYEIKKKTIAEPQVFSILIMKYH